MNKSSSSESNVSEMFAQAAKSFQSALEAGIKMQQESTKSLSGMIQDLGSPQQWQQRAQEAMEKMMDAARGSMDETIQLMNDNTKSSLELLEKAFQAQQAAAPQDGQAKARELWETAIGSFRRNAEVLVQANNRMLESWAQMTKLLQGEEPAKKAD